jgi:hypothetical protein
MKKVFGFILLGVGIVSLIKVSDTGAYSTGAGILGALIGALLFCGLPAYFLLRSKKEYHKEDDKNQ